MLLLLCLSFANADTVVYDDALASGWASWSWSGTYTFDSATHTYAGGAAIHVQADAYGALALHSDVGFDAPAARLYVYGDPGDLSVMLEADGEGYASDTIRLGDLATFSTDGWTEVAVDLTALGDHAWTRFDLFNNSITPVDVWVDEITLLDSLPEADPFLGAEAVGARTVVIYGTVDASAAEVALDGASVEVTEVSTATNPDRSVLTLGRALTAGTLTVTVGGTTTTRTLGSGSATIDDTPGRAISPWIYGIALPDDLAAVDQLGASVVRWGGNATSLYNPELRVTNHAFDWYFENSEADDADAWLEDVTAAGAVPFFSVPALDWVAADDSGCSYSVSRYGAQQDADPWKPDCGNGKTTGGTEISWNDPADASVPWDEAQAGDWLGGLAVPPVIVAIDNELDIASSTHRDVHVEPMGYDELYNRWWTYARVVKETLPDALVTGPSSCCWWYYWNSAAGDADQAAHGGEDLLPWWLDQVAEADAALGERTLDYLDIHYYPNDVFNNDTSAAVSAMRLRSTRGLWDPSYTDEGWIGTDIWATDAQPSPNEVQLIPRFKALIDAHYPGTGLAIGEWNFGAEGDLSGALAIADVLGIFGREGVDLATYWTTPALDSPAAAAFALYRDPDLPFGDTSLDVAFDDPDLLGVYAAVDGERTTVVLVNKDPDQDLALTLDGLPAGAVTARHLSATTDGVLVQDGALPEGSTVIVPAYGALFLSIGEGGGADSGGSGGDGSGGDGSGGDSAGGGGAGGVDSAADTGEVVVKAGDCACAATSGPRGWPVLLALALLRRRHNMRIMPRPARSAP